MPSARLKQAARVPSSYAIMAIQVSHDEQYSLQSVSQTDKLETLVETVACYSPEITPHVCPFLSRLLLPANASLNYLVSRFRGK